MAVLAQMAEDWLATAGGRPHATEPPLEPGAAVKAICFAAYR